MADNNDILIQEAGEQVGRVINAETLDFTGNVKFNFKQGRLINWNVERTGWPKKNNNETT